MKRKILASLLCLAAAYPPAALATTHDNWPQWRGPLSTGSAPQASPPVRFGEKENLRFKVEVPGQGLASPIVWGQDIFLLTAVPVGAAPVATEPQGDRGFAMVGPVAHRFELIAFSRQDGSIRWRRTVDEGTPHESHHLDASWASASAVTDGKRIVAHFGSRGTAAFSLSGEKLWSVDLGDMATRNSFGEGSSPLLADDKVVILWDHQGDSFIVALDAASGKELWRKARPGEVTSWATPVLVEAGGRKQVVVPATGKTRGYDLATGEEIWWISGMTTNVVPSAVAEGSLAIVMSGFRGNMLQAIDLEAAKGDVAGTPALRYSYDRDTPYVPSPLLHEGHLYFLKHNSAILSVLDAKTGKVHYKEQRLPELANVYAAPVAAAGKVYVVGRDGNIAVFRHGAAFELLASIKLDDRFDSSPALAGKDLILRGHRYLYLFAEPAS
jgi:outer membrane protein assembly factor BamB